MTILWTAVVALIVAFLLGFLLGAFKKIFHVEVDPTVQMIRDCLPGANCGGCGFPGCDGFAAAVAKKEAPVDGCSAGGVETAKNIATVMGVTSNARPKAAVVSCRGDCDAAVIKGEFVGIQTCSAAKAAINGTKVCNFACIGFGDCVNVCKFDAITLGEKGLPVVNTEKCTGCGACSRKCPQGVIQIFPSDITHPVALCSNRSENKPALLKQCKNACIKCGKCEKSCEQGAITLQKGIPVVDEAKCDGCKKCVEGCPTKVLAFVFKENA